MAKSITKTAIETMLTVKCFNPANNALEDKHISCNGFIPNEKALEMSAAVLVPCVPVMVLTAEYNVYSYEMPLEDFYRNANRVYVGEISADDAAKFGKRNKGGAEQ